MSFGENLKQARINYGMTQAEFGNFLGCSRQSIGLYESGKRTPKLQDVVVMSEKLNMNLVDLDHSLAFGFGSDVSCALPDGKYEWIDSDDQRPQIGSVGIDGFGNYPEVLTTIVELKTELGESLYFTKRYLDEVRRSKGSKYELTICKDASIRWWLPLPPRPATKGIETDEDEH